MWSTWSFLPNPTPPLRYSASGLGRDVFNEPPSKEDLAVATEASAALARARLGSEAVVHTSRGDVHIKFMADVAPKVRFRCSYTASM